MDHFSRVESRFWETLYCTPKIFFGAFMWQGFGLACNCSDHLTGYYFLTGFGGAFGTLLGHWAFYLARAQSHHHVKAESIRGLLYAVSAFFGPATAWQRIANDASAWDWNFTAAFFFMWFIAGLVFFASIQCFRKFSEEISKYYPIFRVIDPPYPNIFADMTLALSVGLGDAFFLGTLANDFDDNWLKPAFGVNSQTNDLVAMIKAGASALIGFLIAQTFQNLFFPSTWADKPLDDEADPIRRSLMAQDSAIKNGNEINTKNKNILLENKDLELASSSKKEIIITQAYLRSDE